MKRVPLLAWLVAGWLATSCGPQPAPVVPPPAEEPKGMTILNVGVLLPLKGPGSKGGEDVLNGLAMAAEEVNAAGGVGGNVFRLVVRDTRSEPDRAKKAVAGLVEEDKAFVLVGGLAGGSAEAAEAAEAAQVPMLALGGTMPGIPSREPWIFRPCQTDFHSGRVMARCAANLNVRRVVVVYDPSNAFSKNLAAAFVTQFKRRPDARVSGEVIDGSLKDLAAVLERVRRKNPDAIYLPLLGDQAVEVVRKAREMGLTVPVLGTASWDTPEFLDFAGPAGDNCYFPARYHPELQSEAAGLFRAGYETKYGRPPSAMAAMGYDALAMIAEAVRTAHSATPADVKSALAKMRNFPGLTGPITTDPDLARLEEVAVLRCENGKPRFLEMVPVH